MTYEEFIEKYGDEEVKFVSYYKYDFVFESEKLKVGCGGDRDDIYRLKVNTEPIKVRELELISWAEIDGEFYAFGW